MQTSIKKNLAVTGVGLGIVVLAMIWSVVNTALASIQKDISATVLQLQWMMNNFGIFLCIPLLTMGKLGDAYGRKKFFLFGLFLAFLASIIGGFATRIEYLIACMGLFGLAGSMILPLSQALLVHQFPENQKEKAVAIWSLFVSVAVAFGPLVSGVILNWLSWQWIYWINIPLTALAFATVCLFVEKEKEHHNTHCAWVSVSFFALIVGSSIMAIMQGPSWGWTSLPILALYTLFVVSLAIFILLEKKTKYPLFRPDLFSNRGFLFSAIPNGCTIGFIWITFFIIPLYLQNMLHFSPFQTGLSLLPLTLPVFFFSVTVSKCYPKWGAKPLMLIGYTLFLAAFLLQAFRQPTYWTLGISSLAIGFGWVMTWGPSISKALSSIPHNIAGIASGMFTTLQEFGAILSLAISGVVFRIAQTNYLQPHMDQLPSPPPQWDSLLSDPVAAAKELGANAPILPWLNNSFLAGYEGIFCFLVGSCLFAIFFTILLPKQQK